MARRTILGVLAFTVGSAVALASCAPGAPGNGVQFTGAISGREVWTGTPSYWIMDGNRSLTILATSIASDADSISVRVDMGQVGEPRTGTFQTGVDDSACVAVVQEVIRGRTWAADANLGNSSCRFTFTSVQMTSEEMTSRGLQRNYEIHGSMTASLTPVGSATGTIELSGNF